MPDSNHGAQRASEHRGRSLLIGLFAAVFAVGGLAAIPARADASGLKVTVVVGPVGGSTSNYITNAKRYANLARSYGAEVVEVYSPNATWARVKAAAVGANVFIYLGHGNGWPSPYGPFSVYRKDGLGLNATAGAGHSNVKYYGEYYVERGLDLAPNAVVILNRLCYASGNSEWGAPNPTKSVAIKRVDNFGAGFLGAGAGAVYAIGIGNASFVLKGFLQGAPETTVEQVFWSDPEATVSYRIRFESVRTPGAKAVMDPYRPSRYYRSVIGNTAMTVGEFRGQG
ncbi:MAG TPA: hypothetical protein VFK54_09515 [Candidatus Limnocylindrales bacterium]|nr:hypothetical protein [Candidatus Limnocylindrales bacterium]